MEYSKEQTDDLKLYCDKVSMLVEGNVTFFHLEGLRLPTGCTPPVCDALLCPIPRENYPSRLYLSKRIAGPYTRNWNASDARIGERNWFAFSWKVELAGTTLTQLLLAHLNGFAKEK